MRRLLRAVILWRHYDSDPRPFPIRNMTNTRTTHLSSALTSLIMPISLGLAMYFGISILIVRQVISDPTLIRYLTGHPISHVTVAMFCIGVVALLIIANNVFDQFCAVRKIRLGSADADPHSETPLDEPAIDAAHSDDQTSFARQAELLIEQMSTLPTWQHHHYLWQRLHAALRFVVRSGGAVGMDEELKYLSEMDLERQQRRYSLIRILIWATPMLGFLGTVLGISQALGGIEVGPENDFGQMLSGLRGSLYVAFDTTALALTLSIILMFMQFLVDRFEAQLLETVDRQTQDNIAALFTEEAFMDPKTGAIQRIGRTVLETSNQLVQQQSELWRESIRSAELAWVDTIAGVSETVRHNLATSIDSAVKNLATYMAELIEGMGNAIDRADSAMAKRWEQWQVVLSENARNMGEHQCEMNRQTELVKDLLLKLDNVSSYQTALDRNLDALAATSRLQDTLENLATTIARLNANHEFGLSTQSDNPSLRIHPEYAAPKQAAGEINRYRTQRQPKVA